MRTIIDENGCNSHPHGGNALEVKVPLIINGTNILEQLEQLNASVLQLNEKLQNYEQTIKKLEERLSASPNSALTETENSETTAKSAPAKKNTGKSTTATDQA